MVLKPVHRAKHTWRLGGADFFDLLVWLHISKYTYMYLYMYMYVYIHISIYPICLLANISILERFRSLNPCFKPNMSITS